MRRVAQPGEVVERRVGDLVDDGVDHHDASAAAQHARHLAQRRDRLGQAVEGAATDHQAEGGVLEGQRVEVGEREGDVARPDLGGQAAALVEGVGQLVDGLDAAHAGAQRERRHADAACVVEHGVVARGPGDAEYEVCR